MIGTSSRFSFFLSELCGEMPFLRSDVYPPICTIVLDAGTKSGSPM
jgi:hypothetical protein